MAKRKKGQDEKAWQEYLDEVKQIVAGRQAPVNETPEEKKARIDGLLAAFELFCEYYFPHYMTSKFGWFHRKAAKLCFENPKIFAVLEWPRGHAKSIFTNVMLPLFLKAHGQLNGMIVTSNNEDKAIMLLMDIRAELEANERYINDFGEQVTFGDWKSDTFTTRDGIGFWAYGRGQSPRGTRKGAKRPNYISVDDIDDKKLCKNRELVKETVDWVLEDLMGCFDPLIGGRFMVAGNRIHKFSVLAHLVGDLEDEDPVKEHIAHIKVYALENPKTHKMDQSEKGVPAWKERLKREDVVHRMTLMGYRAAQREYFHIHIIDGETFKNEWLIWENLPAKSSYPCIVAYCDPSYKDTARNDYKAIVAVAKYGKYYDIVDVFVAQTSRAAMVRGHYDMNDTLQSNGAKLVYNYLEANFIQDMHLDAYVAEGETRGYMLPIHPDKRAKPPKTARIENLTPLFERGLVRFDKKLRKSRHMQAFLDQLLAFPSGHDDGPDALEGAVYILNQKSKIQIPHIPTGGQRRSSRNRL